MIGVYDKTLDIIGTDTYNYDRQKAILRLTERCVNLSTEGLDVEEFITNDTRKKVWVIHIPKHRIMKITKNKIDQEFIAKYTR